MSPIYWVISDTFDATHHNKCNMKEIFKGLVGMTLIAGLLLVFNTITEFNAPGLGLLKSAVKGFVYVTFTMGVLIIAKSGIELLCKNSFKR